MPLPGLADEPDALCKMPFERILVTGADGFVGGHLLPALRKCLVSGARLFVATRKPADDQDVSFDLNDPCSVAAAIERVVPDLIIHLAAQSSVGQSAQGAADTWAVNVGGTLAIATAVATHAPECTFFFVSSAEVYGLSFNDGVANEDTSPRPQSPYARSKVAAEWLLGDVLPRSCQLIIVRPSNHSGPGQDERFVIPAFAAQIARIESGAVSHMEVGNLDAERDFLDVRDVIAGYIAVLVRADTLPQRNLFNIASGASVRIAQILQMLCSMSPADTRTRSDPARIRPSEVPTAAIDARAFRVATHWEPARSLAETLAAVLADQRGRLAR